jgi:hypothetical protein
VSSGLWRKHLATPNQQRLVFRQSNRSGRATQADVLLSMLRKARADSRAVPLPEIMAAGIAQHSARLFEIRKRGFVVENQTERAADGRVLSRYWLRYDPERDGEQK